MKKIIYNQYGDFSQLQIVDVEELNPSSDQVIVKVKAVAINPLDWKLLEGQLKFLTGKKFPRSIGIEFSGIIEKTGNSANKFKVGDQVVELHPKLTHLPPGFALNIDPCITPLLRTLAGEMRSDRHGIIECNKTLA